MCKKILAGGGEVQGMRLKGTVNQGRVLVEHCHTDTGFFLGTSLGQSKQSSSF